MHIERYWENDFSLWTTSRKDSLVIACLAQFRHTSEQRKL